MTSHELCRSLFDYSSRISFLEPLLEPVGGNDLGQGYRHVLWLGTEEQFELQLTKGLTKLVSHHLALSSQRDWTRQHKWINQMFGEVFRRTTTDRPAFIWTTPIWKILSRPSFDKKRWSVQVNRPSTTKFLGPCRTPTLQAISAIASGRVQIPFNKLDLPRRRGIREQIFTMRRERTVLDSTGRPIGPLQENRLTLGHPSEDAEALLKDQQPMERMLFCNGGGSPYVDAINIHIGILYNTSDQSTALVKRSSFSFDREARFLGYEDSSWPFQALMELHPDLRALLTEAVIQLNIKKSIQAWPNVLLRNSRLAW
ncbi:MAG: hypothetical protein SFX18_17655 [Pirellulales bacterium]|nr:hypothetical protein [Pirellulales bacterium]